MKKFVGTVVSVKGQKTAVVCVDRLWQHPLYKKRIKRTKKYHVHDEIGVKKGDRVEIVESRPISKMKKWRIKSDPGSEYSRRSGIGSSKQ